MVDQVSERILGGLPNLNSAGRDELKTLFWKEDGPESLELPVIHQIVLGLNPGSLEEELKNNDTAIDAQDRLGYTAIAWAGDDEFPEKDWFLLIMIQRKSIIATHYGFFFNIVPTHIYATFGDIVLWITQRSVKNHRPCRS